MKQANEAEKYPLAPKTERDVATVLSLKFCQPEFSFLRQVRNSTGFQKVERTADAMALQCYPSRGLGLHGFEIKVSRADLKKELEDPDKAEEVARFCDYWWLAVSDRKITEGFHLPKTWGLICCRTGKAVTVKTAGKMKAQELDRKFIASILRCLARADPNDGEYLNQLIDKARHDERVKARRKIQAIPAVQKTREQELINQFHAKTGLNLSWILGGDERANELICGIKALSEMENRGSIIRGIKFQATKMEEHARKLRIHAEELEDACESDSSTD